MMIKDKLEEIREEELYFKNQNLLHRRKQRNIKTG